MEPLFQRVRTLLDGADVISPDAIAVKLEKYNPEHGVFTGSLTVHTALVDLKALIFVPMKRDAARAFWKNKNSLIGRMSLAMNVHSLDIEIEELWLEEPQSGSRTTERIAVVEEISSSEEQQRRANGFEAIAASLGKQAVRNYESSKYGNPKNAVKGSIAEYNRVVREAKSVFTRDPHVQALAELSFSGSSYQGAWSVATAALGLERYMASFNSSEAIKAIAASLGKQAVRNYESSKYGNPKNAVKGSIAEYNRVVREAKSVFTRDPHVQALAELSFRALPIRELGR